MNLLECLEQRRTARGLVLQEADLRAAQLAGLRADGIDLRGSDLRDAVLEGVRWEGCNLSETRLGGANFSGAVLRVCGLDHARAAGVRFVRASLENSTAQGAVLDNADFRGAILTDTDFSRASLRGANFEGASASGASFHGADLRGANLRDADLTGADFEGAIGVEMAPSMDELAGLMAPIVIEALRTGGRTGAIPPETAGRLAAQASALTPVATPESTPNPETRLAVSRLVAEYGANFQLLLAAMNQKESGDPPAEVRAFLLRLREVLRLDENANMEDVLRALADF